MVCSSFLVGVYLVWKVLMSGEVELCVVGGVMVCMLYGVGYFWGVDDFWSLIGEVWLFDVVGDGGMFGSGVGVVVFELLDWVFECGVFILGVLSVMVVGNDGLVSLSFGMLLVKGF